jgi:predicted MFS family arabinose efflux permease
MSTSASSKIPKILDVIPLIAVGSVGYVLFAPGAVPGTLIDRFEIGYTAFGLLTSAPLLSIVLAQAPSGYLTARYSTTRVLLVVTAIHVLLAITIDVANSFLLLFTLRTIWGLVGGAVLTVGATHIARLH